MQSSPGPKTRLAGLVADTMKQLRVVADDDDAAREGLQRLRQRIDGLRHQGFVANT